MRVFGPPIDAHGVYEADFTTPGTVHQVGLPPRRIDLLTEIIGVPFDDAWKDRTHISIAGLEVDVLGRESLLRNKRAIGRPRDVADLAALGENDP